MDAVPWLVSNIIAATVLAGAAALVARLWSRPALVHGLCVLALLKLVTPPLFTLPVLPRVQEAPPAVESTVTWAALAMMESAIDVAPVPPPPAIGTVELVLIVWAVGSLVVLALILLRSRRFASLLRHAKSPSPGLAAEAQVLATRIGLRRAPAIAVIPARVSPLLWPSARQLHLVLPDSLLRTLTPDQRATLLLHELAHVRRRDHWVRALETSVSVLFWWLPTLWWVRRTLRAAEEQCCDAWVVWALPDSERDYADALLSTVDFLSGARFALPPGASGAGPVHHLKQRLTLIMDATTPRTLGAAGRLGVLLLAAVLLPVLPTWAQERERSEAREKRERAGETEELRGALERIEGLERMVEKLLAERRGAKSSYSQRARSDAHDAYEEARDASRYWRERARDEAKSGDAYEAARKNFYSAMKAMKQYRTQADGSVGQWTGDAEAAKHVRKAMEQVKAAQYHTDETVQKVLRDLRKSGALERAQEGQEIAERVLESLEASGVLDETRWNSVIARARAAERARGADAYGDGADAAKSKSKKEKESRYKRARDQYRRADGDDEAEESQQRIAELQAEIQKMEQVMEDLRAELRRLRPRRAIR